MTPDARDLALKAIGACLRTELDDQELAGLVQNVETAIRAAVDKAVAREREANCHTVCQLCARGEQVQFSKRLGWWHPKIARGRGAKCEAAAIRARSRGEGEG